MRCSNVNFWETGHFSFLTNKGANRAEALDRKQTDRGKRQHCPDYTDFVRFEGAANRLLIQWDYSRA
jgi:hypothetical protein